MPKKNVISVLLMASFLSAYVFPFGQTKDRPEIPQNNRESGRGPQAFGKIAKENLSTKTSPVKWLILGGLIVAAGVVIYLVTSKSRSTSVEKVGSISIESDPTEAKVYLDGNDTGQVTSCTLSNIKVGLHDLKIDLETYGQWKGQIEVKENQTVKVSAKLAPYNYIFVTKWGSYGTGDGQFYRPSGLAIDRSDNIYVSDSFNNRIQKFASSGAFITKWGSLGTADGQIDLNDGIAVDSSGIVYVSDGAGVNHRVQKFTSSGLFLGKWGSFGAGEGQFYIPAGIAVSTAGHVFVCDWELARIQKFTTDGIFLKAWGSFGAADGQFNHPLFLALDKEGNVYVTEYDNHRIQKFSPDGLFLGKWGTQGSGEGQFRNPSGIMIDKAGFVYVGDSMNHRIQKFTPEGKFVTAWGSFGNGDGQFNQVSGIAQDSQGFIYASDYDNHRIQKFQLSTETMEAAKITYMSVSPRKSSDLLSNPSSLEAFPAKSGAPREGPGSSDRRPGIRREKRKC